MEQAKFDYSPLNKFFNKRLKEENKEEVLLKRLKNIEDCAPLIFEQTFLCSVNTFLLLKYCNQLAKLFFIFIFWNMNLSKSLMYT